MKILGYSFQIFQSQFGSDVDISLLRPRLCDASDKEGEGKFKICGVVEQGSPKRSAG